MSVKKEDAEQVDAFLTEQGLGAWFSSSVRAELTLIGCLENVRIAKGGDRKEVSLPVPPYAKDSTFLYVIVNPPVTADQTQWHNYSKKEGAVEGVCSYTVDVNANGTVQRITPGRKRFWFLGR